MVIAYEILARITMEVPGRILARYDMISGRIVVQDYNPINFKCIMTEMDGICEIDTELNVEVSKEAALGVQKHVAEIFYGKTDFHRRLSVEDFHSSLRTPGNEFIAIIE